MTEVLSEVPVRSLKGTKPAISRSISIRQNLTKFVLKVHQFINNHKSETETHSERHVVVTFALSRV